MLMNRGGNRVLSNITIPSLNVPECNAEIVLLFLAQFFLILFGESNDLGNEAPRLNVDRVHLHCNHIIGCELFATSDSFFDHFNDANSSSRRH